MDAQLGRRSLGHQLAQLARLHGNSGSWERPYPGHSVAEVMAGQRPTNQEGVRAPPAQAIGVSL